MREFLIFRSQFNQDLEKLHDLLKSLVNLKGIRKPNGTLCSFWLKIENSCLGSSMDTCLMWNSKYVDMTFLRKLLDFYMKILIDN